jgi:MarR family transcriptional regulator, 2-MHQ and catechol-resistance regulon repressor
MQRGRGSLARDAEAFSEALEKLARIYQLQDPRRTCTYGITLTECYALETLVLDGPLTVNEVAAALGLDKSTASRAVASLVQKGFGARRGHPEDGRAVAVSATAAGARLNARIREAGRAAHREILAEFPPEVRRAAAALLQRLATTERACAGSGPRTAARR